MASLIKVGFAGSYKADILLFMARIFHALGKKVTVVDATDEQYLVYSIPNYLNNKVITYENTDFYLGCNTHENYEKIPFEKYDIAFIDFGFNKSMTKCCKSSDRIILITDLERHNVMRLRDFISDFIKKEHSHTDANEKQSDSSEIESREILNESCSFTRIYRDIVDSKINVKYLDSLLDVSASINITSQYLIYLDDCDYRIRIESQYDDCFRFHKLSKVYKIMFSELIVEYMDIPRKDADKAIRVAEKGG